MTYKNRIAVWMMTVLCLLLCCACNGDGTSGAGHASGDSGGGTNGETVYEMRAHAYRFHPLELSESSNAVYTAVDPTLLNTDFNLYCGGVLDFHQSSHASLRFSADGTERQVMDPSSMAERFSEVNPAYRAVLRNLHLCADGTSLLPVITEDTEADGFFMVRCDADMNITEQSDPIPFCDKTKTAQLDVFYGRLICGESFFVWYNTYDITEIRILDAALGVHGPFSVDSAVLEVTQADDGTLLLSAEDGSAYRYSPQSDQLTREWLVEDTENARRAERIVSRCDGVYLFCYDGIYVQRDGEETLLLDYAASYLDSRTTHIMDILPEDGGFFAWHTDALTGSAYPALLLPPGDAPTPVRTPLTLVSVNCGTDGAQMLSAAVNTFNREHPQYVIVHHDLDRAPGTGQTDSAEAAAERMREWMLSGCPGDLLVIGKYAAWLTKPMLGTMEEQNLFADLSGYADRVSMITAARSDTAGMLLPLTGSLQALAAKPAVLSGGGDLTREQLYALAGALEDGGVLFDDPGVSVSLLQVGIADFIDREAGACTFDSPAFGELVKFCQAVRDCAEVSGGMLSSVEGQDAYLREMHIDSRDSLANEIRKCSRAGTVPIGYPTENSGVLRFIPNLRVALLADSTMTEGAYAFLDLLFSDTVQSSPALTAEAIPVTVGGWEQLLVPGFWCFSGAETEHTYPSLVYVGQDSFTEAELMMYRIDETVHLSSENHRRLFSFFTQTPGRTEPEPVIASIVNEELSAVTAGVRSAADAAAIIQSRVSIYLSE